MKKLLLVLAILFTVTSCSNSGKNNDNTADTVVVDTVIVDTTSVDSIHVH